MLEELQDQRILRVLSLREDDTEWKGELDRILRGDSSLTRDSAGEGAIKAVQRLLIFLGYSTSSSGAFVVDGDFGRGTNRGVAQFRLEHGLLPEDERNTLCYECSFQTARKRIVIIPDVRLDIPTLERMAWSAVQAIENNEVTFGRLEDALFHLNSLDQRRFLSCREIEDRYGVAVDTAVATIREELGITIQREWILAIIKQETSGIVRPRFEQHVLSRLHRESPAADFAELRLRSMSIGLGQIMGFNHQSVGAPSARAMLSSRELDQVLYIARFIARKRDKDILAKKNPTESDFRSLALFYNGPAYESHFYHERLETWFREFRIAHG